MGLLRPHRHAADLGERQRRRSRSLDRRRRPPRRLRSCCCSPTPTGASRCGDPPRTVPVAGHVGLALAVLAAVALPVAALGPVALDSGDVIFLTGWALLAFRCIARGLHRAAPVWWRTGFGLGIIAAGQLLAGPEPRHAGGDPKILQLPALRLLGVLVVATALTRYTRQLVHDRRDRATQRAEQAAVAAHAEAAAVPRDPQRAVEPLGDQHVARPRRPPEAGRRAARARPRLDRRDHQQRVRPAAQPAGDLVGRSESHRDAGRPRADPAGDAAAAHRQRHHAQLPARAGGRRPGGDLAQVVTNLLANCARHAPGAEIHVSARATPVPASSRSPTPVPVCGSCGKTATTGSGLGLELSSRLVSDFGRRPPADGRHPVPLGDDGAALPSAASTAGARTGRPGG